ncbi:MAG: SIS domain-containing protein [Oxalobacteraceae bacterium]|jgi:D-sedoheptulose 7-phosphate isomerase|nr:SIS domain-containing protein [Oxalobacteraceae bacterium]
MSETFLSQFLESKNRLKSCLDATFEDTGGDVVSAVSAMVATFKSGGRVLVCGNGGSAADAMHFAGELVATFQRDVPRPALSAIALSADLATITAYANDFSYDDIFARQVNAHGRKGDCLLAISTSGKSRNVIRAANEARSREISVISIVGRGGDALIAVSDIAVVIPSTDTQIIQNTYQFLLHVICYGIESQLRD